MIEFGHCTIAPLFQGAALAVEDEAYGFDIRYFGENHSLHPDPFVALFDAARATRKIKLATGVVNMVARHPSALANLAAPLQLASGGRAILGIGKGDSAVGMIGRGPQKHDEFVASMKLLRTFLAGESVRLGHYDSSLAWLKGLPYTPVPIEVACAGPRSIAAAAALADRIQLTVGGAPERIGWALEIIDRALAESGRSRRDVKVGALIPLVVDPDRKAAVERLRTGAAVIAHMSALPGIDLGQQPEKLRRVTERLREAYSYRHHNMEQVNPMRDLVDAEFADWYGIGGPASYVVERMGELAELGLDFFFLGTIPAAERKVLASEVMPVIRALEPKHQKR